MTPSPASFLLLLSLLLVLPATNSSSSLRGLSTQFQYSWVLPFGMQWLMTISDQVEIDPRGATPEEEDAIRQSTQDWFATEIPIIYAAEAALFQFNDLNCTIFDTTYDGAWRHTILMNCEVTFDGNDLDDLPGNEDFLLDMNMPVKGFRNNHLLQSEATGMFHFSRKVGYITINRGDWLSASGVGEETFNNTASSSNSTYTITTNSTDTSNASNATAP